MVLPWHAAAVSIGLPLAFHGALCGQPSHFIDANVLAWQIGALNSPLHERRLQTTAIAVLA